MPHRNTQIGKVRAVLGGRVTVELDPTLVGVMPLWEGRGYPVGQVGSLVMFPQGPMRLVGAVVTLGIGEVASTQADLPKLGAGDRWLTVQLLGEISPSGRFDRGVTRYPGLDDRAHFATVKELQAVYPAPSDTHVAVGTLSGHDDVAVALDLGKLVCRHGAVVGSTGSGKTSSVASLVQNVVTGGWGAANVVVMDPHGEYLQAFPHHGSLRSVSLPGDHSLRVPFWLLSAADILTVLCGTKEGATVSTRFRELVAEARQSYATTAAWFPGDAVEVTADSPVPFDIAGVWFKMDTENRWTFNAVGGAGGECIVRPGDAATLRPTHYRPHAAGNQAPFKGPLHGAYGSAPERMRLRLKDERLRFFFNQPDPGSTADPLIEIIDEWLGGDKPISVLDFSGADTDVTSLAVGAILTFLLEVAMRSTQRGIGRNKPILLVLEEAHRYLGDAPATVMAKEATNRIAREGRKYGIGLLLVSQRPSELPETALSQVGTIIGLRLTNAPDQGTVKAALPDNVSGLADVLSSLRSGEAVIAGEAIALPSRVQVRRPYPEPRAGDAGVTEWRVLPKDNQIAQAVKAWRGTTGDE